MYGIAGGAGMGAVRFLSAGTILDRDSPDSRLNHRFLDRGSASN
jgi:hypothetical protein